MKSSLKNGIGEILTDYGTRVMKIFKRGLLGQSLFEFYGDIKATKLYVKEVASTPPTPLDKEGGVVYVKNADGKLYYKSNEVAEVEVSAINTDTTYSIGDGGLTEKNFTSTLNTKLDGIASSATAYADADAVSAVSTADDYLKNDAADTISGDLTIDSSWLTINDQSGSGFGTRIGTDTLTGNKTLTLPDDGGTLALIDSQKHFINFGVNLAYTYARYIPIGSYYIYEQNTDANPEYTTYVAPYDGKFIKALVRSEESLASTSLTIYKVGDGTEEPDQGSVVDTKSVDIASANTSYTFTFDSDATFSKGDAISIKIQPTTDPVAAGVVGTFVLQFDLTT